MQRVGPDSNSDFSYQLIHLLGEGVSGGWSPCRSQEALQRSAQGAGLSPLLSPPLSFSPFLPLAFCFSPSLSSCVFSLCLSNKMKISSAFRKHAGDRMDSVLGLKLVHPEGEPQFLDSRTPKPTRRRGRYLHGGSWELLCQRRRTDLRITAPRPALPRTSTDTGFISLNELSQ